MDTWQFGATFLLHRRPAQADNVFSGSTSSSAGGTPFAIGITPSGKAVQADCAPTAATPAAPNQVGRKVTLLCVGSSVDREVSFTNSTACGFNSVVPRVSR